MAGRSGKKVAVCSLRLTVEQLDGTGNGNVNWLFRQFAMRFPEEITATCKITEHTEWQLDNFGPGSAWLCESPFELNLRWDVGGVQLTIECGVDDYLGLNEGSV